MGPSALAGTRLADVCMTKKGRTTAWMGMRLCLLSIEHLYEGRQAERDVLGTSLLDLAHRLSCYDEGADGGRDAARCSSSVPIVHDCGRKILGSERSSLLTLSGIAPYQQTDAHRSGSTAPDRRPQRGPECVHPATRRPRAHRAQYSPSCCRLPLTRHTTGQ